MNSRIAYLSVVLAVMADAALIAPDCAAQVAPLPPARPSFSNGGGAAHPKAASAGLRKPSQEELVDAVLGDSMQRLWEQTDSHGHDGEFNHVINLGRVVEQGDPHNLEAFATPAYLLWSANRNDAAEAVLKDGIAANPSDYYMYDEMGMYWSLERKNPMAALPYYEKAVKFDCPFITWNSLANCYEKAGQWDKAVKAWEKATLYPNDLVANRRLKQARQKLAQQKVVR